MQQMLILTIQKMSGHHSVSICSFSFDDIFSAPLTRSFRYSTKTAIKEQDLLFTTSCYLSQG